MLNQISVQFQSTSPVRGTTEPAEETVRMADISIHVPREGDDGDHRVQRLAQLISIHVPREGDDNPPEAWIASARYFNPRPP